MFVNTDFENIKLIRKSKYFDKKYYLLENPKLKGDPCRHYYYHGWKEGKSPSFDFSTTFYLKNYKDVQDAGINPLIHYLKFGKAENRIIEKDNGLSLKKVYEKVYGCVYFYKTYICDSGVKRLNLLFDVINSDINKLIDLLEYVCSFCEVEGYQLRIVYFKADFELLKKVLQENKIVLPKNTIFLNLKSSNYLEVGLNEKYVCTSWKTARALLNTSSINSNIYYYLTNDLKNLPDEEFYQVSNICVNPHVTIITRDKKNLSLIKKCRLKFEIGDSKLNLGKNNQLYCDFNKMFIVGVELLNDVFLTGIFDSKSWRVNIIETNNNFKFHFDTNVRIEKTFEIGEDANFIFHMSYDKKEVLYDKPYVNAWVEKEDVKLNNYILIDDKKDFSKLINDNDFSISNIDNYYDEFKKYICKLRDEG